MADNKYRGKYIVFYGKSCVSVTNTAEQMILFRLKTATAGFWAGGPIFIIWTLVFLNDSIIKHILVQRLRAEDKTGRDNRRDNRRVV